MSEQRLSDSQVKNNKSEQWFFVKLHACYMFLLEEVIIRHPLFVPDDFLLFVGLLLPDTVGCPYPIAVSHTLLKRVS